MPVGAKPRGIDRRPVGAVYFEQRRKGNRAPLANTPSFGPIGEDAKEPSLQARPPLKAIDSLYDTGPRFLHDLFGNRATFHKRKRKPKQRCMVTLEQFTKRTFVTSTEALDQNVLCVFVPLVHPTRSRATLTVQPPMRHFG